MWDSFDDRYVTFRPKQVSPALAEIERTSTKELTYKKHSTNTSFG